MGCGASQHAVATSPVQQEGKQEHKLPEEKPLLEKEVSSKCTSEQPLGSDTPGKDLDDKAPLPVVKAEQSQAHVAGEKKVAPEASTYDPGDGQQASQASNGPGEANPPAAVVSPGQASSGGCEPVQTQSTELDAERTSQPLRAQELAESPKATRFEGDSEADDTPQVRPPVMAFKSSRSLNRSFGVRRRTSDAGSQGPPEPGSVAAADEEPSDSEPDPLREEFERMKAANPWLVGVTQKSTMNGISGRASEKSLAVSKRPSVGFALAGDGDDDGEGTDNDDVDPDEHIEAERIASIHVPREEVPVPVPALRIESLDGETSSVGGTTVKE